MASSVTEEVARRSIFFVCLQALCENAGLVFFVSRYPLIGISYSFVYSWPLTLLYSYVLVSI